jgi:hypothetical protein
LRVEEIDLIGGEENKEINEKSIQIEITQEELSEYSSFHDNKEFLISTQIKLYHSIIYCNQRLFLFNEIFYYCDRILVLDHLDWVARLKRGLFYYFSHDLKNAEVDFKLAIEGCPHKEDLKYELDKLS